MKSPLEINSFEKYYHYNHSSEYCFAGHSHKEWEVNVVTKGVLSVTYDDRVITLRENMLFLCENDIFHRSRVMSDEGVELFVYQFYTDHIPHSKTPRVYGLDEKNLTLVNLIAEESEKNAKYMEDGAFSSSAPNYQALRLLEVLLIRLTEAENNVDYEAHPDEKLYRNAINFMKDNISKNICINDIAGYCHVSSTKIKTVFADFTGEAIMTHFYNMKINAAKKMLGDGMSAGEVSDALGYSSQAYMSACFRKKTGMSPIKYKKSSNF